ncbi:MAG: alpha/beta fold hydrolase [Phenylobacterium sp.]
MTLIPGARIRTLEADGLAFTAFEMGEGPVALCLHGFPDSPRTWRHLLPALAGHGYRAVAVTARGYEPSSQPADNDYSMAALSDDVAGWLDALDAEQAVLIGHDWGASIAYAAAAKFPERIRRLVTLAVPHPAGLGAAMATDLGQLKRSWYVFFFQLLGLSDAVLEANDFAFVEMLWRDWSPGGAWDALDLAAAKTALAKPGVKAAALAYYRQALDPAAPRLAEGQALAGLPIRAPTLGLAGAADGCISAEVFGSGMPAAVFSGGVEVVTIPAAGHFLQLEAPQAVNAAILDWLGAAA